MPKSIVRNSQLLPHGEENHTQASGKCAKPIKGAVHHQHLQMMTFGGDGSN